MYLKDYNLDLIVDTFILNVYSLESKKEPRKACIYIVEEFHKFFQKDTIVVNKIISNIEYDKLSSWSLMALLRMSYHVKYKIDNWNSLLFFTKQYLEDNNLDSKKELYGLE
jgi:hypothetical protein